jgi:hypothetical protein
MELNAGRPLPVLGWHDHPEGRDMVDFSAWASADPLTVEQAAYLWVGVDPSPLLKSPKEVAAFAPRLQMLTGAIVSGTLKAETRTNGLAIVGDHKNSLVTRVDLMAFAESRGERPAFLFDTMLSSAAENPNSGPAPTVRETRPLLRPARSKVEAWYAERARACGDDVPTHAEDEKAAAKLFGERRVPRKWLREISNQHFPNRKSGPRGPRE